MPVDVVACRDVWGRSAEESLRNASLDGREQAALAGREAGEPGSVEPCMCEGRDGHEGELGRLRWQREMKLRALLYPAREEWRAAPARNAADGRGGRGV